MRLRGAQKASGTAMLCLAALCLSHGAMALELAFPGTTELVRSTGPANGQHPIATGPFDGTVVPLDVQDGIVQTLIWQITGDEMSTATLLQATTAQLVDQGYEITFSCSASACGGFDFRHAVPVGLAPDMHVDLGDFHYMAAQVERESGPEHVAVMISQGGTTGFVHVARVLPVEAVETGPVVLSSSSPGAEAFSGLTQFGSGDLIADLTRSGGAPLDDLRFESGASELSGEMYPSLVTLAAFLEANPARRVVLVGHTDASGSLEGNIALSEARANAVRSFLTRELGVNPGQIEAEGIGFLAPRASNDTAEGREANRRVEVVLADPG